MYVHVNFTQIPANCLEHVKDNWPKDGILRIEIQLANETRMTDKSYTLEKSYEYQYLSKTVNR